MTGANAASARRPGLASGVRVRCPECGLGCYVGVEAWYRTRYESLLQFVRRRAVATGVSEAQLDYEGVVQETFACLDSSLAIVDNPVGWLHKVAERAVMQATQEQRKIAAAALTEDLVHGDRRGLQWVSMSLPADPDTVLAVREVFRVMGRLPYRQRAAVYLRRVEGWSNAEIAAFLGCATPTAAVHAHRGATYIFGSFHASATCFGAAAMSGDVVVHGERDNDSGWVWCSCWGGDPQWGIGEWCDEAAVYRLLERRHPGRPGALSWRHSLDASAGTNGRSNR